MSTSIIFTQAYNPGLVLGQQNWITHVKEQQLKDQKVLYHDLKIEYFCDDTWDISATLHPTNYSQAEPRTREVDKNTCALLAPTAALEPAAEAEKERLRLTSNEDYFRYKRDDGHWTNLILVLISMSVSTGFFASYTPTAFYTGLIVVLGT